jgi:hypothetical protein
MRKLLIVLLLVLNWTPVSAEHFNQDNIIEECAKDSSFNSRCYTYIAAYKDFLAFYTRTSDENRKRILCLRKLTTKRIVERLAVAEPTAKDYRVPVLIIDEFCN